MSDDLDAEIAQLDLHDRLEYLGPLLAALTVVLTQVRKGEHAYAPLTWSVERAASLLEVCDQLEPLAWNLYDAAAKALYAEAEERAYPSPLLPYPPERFQP